MKPVTSHAEWPSFLRTKTETGTETSVPVSIHTPQLPAPIQPAPPRLRASQTPLALGFGNKSVAVEVYALIVSYDEGIRGLCNGSLFRPWRD